MLYLDASQPRARRPSSVLFGTCATLELNDSPAKRPRHEFCHGIPNTTSESDFGKAVVGQTLPVTMAVQPGAFKVLFRLGRKGERKPTTSWAIQVSPRVWKVVCEDEWGEFTQDCAPIPQRLLRAQASMLQVSYAWPHYAYLPSGNGPLCKLPRGSDRGP